MSKPKTVQVHDPEFNHLRDIILERAQTHGEYYTTSKISQDIKGVLRGYLDNLDHDMVESIEMIANKLGRILSGDSTHIDSWQDIAGYAQLIVDRLEEDERKSS